MTSRTHLGFRVRASKDATKKKAERLRDEDHDLIMEEIRRRDVLEHDMDGVEDEEESEYESVDEENEAASEGEEDE